MAFFGATQWVSSRVPEPWDTVVFVATFTVVIMAGARWWARRELRQQALQSWADSVTQPQGYRPPTMVLLSDGDEALLALKIAEGLNVIARGLWHVTFSLPSLVWHTVNRWGKAVYALLALAALAFFLLNDAQSPLVDPAQTWSVPQILKLLLLTLVIPLVLCAPSDWCSLPLHSWPCCWDTRRWYFRAGWRSGGADPSASRSPLKHVRLATPRSRVSVPR